MFNSNQEKFIKVFASVTNINNHCFKQCVFFDKENIIKDLKNEEIECLKICSNDYIDIKDFFQNQLILDFESIKAKNRKIFDDKT